MAVAGRWSWFLVILAAEAAWLAFLCWLAWLR